MMNRRQFGTLSLASLAALAGPRKLWASPGLEERKFLVIYANGGWDYAYVFAPLFDNQWASVDEDSVQSEANGVTFVDAETRPSVRSFFENYGDQACIINGIEVRSITHQRCRRLAFTGSSSATSDDFASILAAHSQANLLLPHTVISGPAYTSRYTSQVVRVGQSQQLPVLLRGEHMEYSDKPIEGVDSSLENAVDSFVRGRARDYLEAARPSPLGAARLAGRIAEAVVRARAPVLPVWRDPSVVLAQPREESFQGHRGQRFTLQMPGRDGVEGVLVAPDRPAAGYPWIWRARFFGHEPDLDRELLSRGYHLAYCDVSGLFGADEALERWDRFYEHCVGLGLSRRMTLEGMSRGGLPVLNWAARHPERVEAIYLDNPVCDFRSWPGGESGKRSDRDWAQCLSAYGLDEEGAAGYDRMPLDRLEPLAEEGVPIFLVLGTADEVVPPAENGEALVARYQELGGPVEVWRKLGVGHHPHGLHPVDPLLRRLLQVTGRGHNPATRAVPSAEYRGHPAGWGGGTWWGQLDKLGELAAANPNSSLVFLGDSITQGLTGSADRVARPGGPRAIDRFHGDRGALSLGLSGDRTEHLLYRIEHGALASLDPEVIVLAIGVNNVNAAGHTGIETAEGLVAVVDALADAEPQAHVLICGPFPAGATPDDPRRVALDLVHERAALLAARERVTYLDLRPLFLDEAGRPNERMSGDHIHVTAAGRAAWMEAIEPTVGRLLAD